MDETLAYVPESDRNDDLARCKYPHHVTIPTELPKRSTRTNL